MTENPHNQISPLYREAVSQLQQSWITGIPISDKMGIKVAAFDGNTIRCEADLHANINVHQTMFAGSIYTLATLTGWGLVHLKLQQAQLGGDIVLADANIKYRRPVSKMPAAQSMLNDVESDFEPLKHGENVRIHVSVDVFSAGKVAAVFSGEYVVIAPR